MPNVIALSLFDPKLPDELKEEIRDTLLKSPNPQLKVAPNEISIDFTHIPGLELSDFISRKSLKMFEILSIPADFLSNQVEIWQDLPEFVSAQCKVLNLTAVDNNPDLFRSLSVTFASVCDMPSAKPTNEWLNKLSQIRLDDKLMHKYFDLEIFA